MFRPPPPPPPPLASHGFSLVEVIIATVLLAIVVGGTATILMSANRSSQRSGLLAETSAAIDTNIAMILKRAEEFTCCSGVCTADAATIAAAGAKCTGSYGDANYYFPDPDNATDLGNFLSRCKPTSATDGLVGPLIDSITGGTNPIPAPAGITRVIAADPDDGSDYSNHRILITYTGAGMTRAIKVTPSIGAWCP